METITDQYNEAVDRPTSHWQVLKSSLERESTTRRNIFGNRGWFSPQLKGKGINNNVNEWRRDRTHGKENSDDKG